jgi:hypothetical protein
MNLKEELVSNFEDRLQGRYITLEHIHPILEEYKTVFNIQILGTSEKGKDIPLLTIGSGRFKILIWSQMHGNETTTTKALFDFMKFITTKSDFQQCILEFCTIKIIPILNPDGAAAYTRENANGADLNRDAIQQTQIESRILRRIFEDFHPQLCLNMHDQRTIYGVKHTRMPATVSFLAPSADEEKKITKSRKEAMSCIVAMQKELEKHIPGQIGRYDDSFNTNCVGDYFQTKGVATILFEAGHYPKDYQREKTRNYIFISLMALFKKLCEEKSTNADYNDYFLIPENIPNRRDIHIKNAILDNIKFSVSIFIQYEETFENKKIQFIPKISAIGDNPSCIGHLEIDAKQKKVYLKNRKSLVVGQIVQKLYIGTNTKDNMLNLGFD